MVGGESKKSKKPLVIAKSRAPTDSRRAPPVSKNANLKGLTSFIACSVSNNVISESKRTASSSRMRIASSENTGDVIVENTSVTMV
jgi:hypothetical protein